MAAFAGANPLVVGLLLAAGVGTLYWVSKKTAPPKAKVLKWYIFTDTCELRGVKPPSKGAAQKFIAQQLIVFGGWDAIGKALGNPPGNLDRNIEFVHAFATHLFRKTVPFKCITSMGLKGNLPTTFEGKNQFGLDYSPEQDKMTSLMVEYFKNAVSGTAQLLVKDSYNVFGGLEAASETPVLADVIRGVDL